MGFPGLFFVVLYILFQKKALCKICVVQINLQSAYRQLWFIIDFSSQEQRHDK